MTFSILYGYMAYIILGPDRHFFASSAHLFFASFIERKEARCLKEHFLRATREIERAV